MNIDLPNELHCALSSARLIQLTPAAFRSSSLFLARGRPTLRLPRRGLHSMCLLECGIMFVKSFIAFDKLNWIK